MKLSFAQEAFAKTLGVVAVGLLPTIADADQPGKLSAYALSFQSLSEWGSS